MEPLMNSGALTLQEWKVFIGGYTSLMANYKPLNCYKPFIDSLYLGKLKMLKIFNSMKLTTFSQVFKKHSAYIFMEQSWNSSNSHLDDSKCPRKETWELTYLIVSRTWCELQFLWRYINQEHWENNITLNIAHYNPENHIILMHGNKIFHIGLK